MIQDRRLTINLFTKNVKHHSNDVFNDDDADAVDDNDDDDYDDDVGGDDDDDVKDDDHDDDNGDTRYTINLFTKNRIRNMPLAGFCYSLPHSSQTQ